MQSGSLEILKNVPLAPLTTLGVGGNARYFVTATSVSTLQQAIGFAHANGMPLFILGGGSNLVVSDGGWNGLVVKVGIEGLDRLEHDGKIQLDVGAGLDWDNFVADCVAEKLAGIECLSGIPGSIGGTPVQNVGAYGQDVSETIISVLAFDLAENRV